MDTKSIIEANEAYKLSLYNQADMLHAEAVENYEIGRTALAHDYENRFNNVLNLLCKFGWAEEYMGIA